MAVQAYLIFNGNCREAVEYYAEVFGTEKPQIMTFGDTPPSPDYQTPEEVKNLVMHTFLTISGSKIMFSDNYPGAPFTQGNNITLALVSNNMDEIVPPFNKLKEDGGKVGMELQETFWSKCYGQITDKYGIHWQFSLEG
jgi:PhnB protein